MDPSINWILLLVLMTGRVHAGSPACSVPEELTNALKVYTGLFPGDTVTYRCRAGFMLTAGTETRTCGSNGNWNGTSPTCTDIDTFFSFVCDVNGTIMATNPDPSSLVWAQASNEDGLCTTAFTYANNSAVSITDCPLDKPITLVYSPLAAGVPALLKDDIKFYNITCSSYPLHGVHVIVTDNSWIRNLVSTSREPARTPVIILNSGLGGVTGSIDEVTPTAGTGPTPGTTPPPGVAINERFRWRIATPEPYTVRPMNCTAFSGPIDDQGSKYSFDIIENACSLDISLVTDFQFENETRKDVAFADLYAFRFPVSNIVEIVCSVRGCPPGSNACDFSCRDRKKRSVPRLSSSSDLYTQMETAEESSRKKRAAGKAGQQTARIAFKVYGPPNIGLNFYESSSLQPAPQWTVILISSIIVLTRHISMQIV